MHKIPRVRRAKTANFCLEGIVQHKCLNILKYEKYEKWGHQTSLGRHRGESIPGREKSICSDGKERSSTTY